MQRLAAGTRGGRAIDAACSTPEDWRILRLLSLYRLLLVTLLIVLFETGHAPRFFETVAPVWFRWTCNAYAVAALGLMLLVQLRRPPLQGQAHLHVLVDIAALSLIVYSCGGVPTGLGTLLITPVVGGALLLRPRLSMLQAAIATLAMLSVELARRLNERFDSSDFTATGVLGLMLFGASIAASTVAQRARRSEALAERVGSEFQNLSRLNESIVETMATGVVVVDAGENIRTLNAAARRLLGLVSDVRGQPLETEAPLLAARLRLWRSDGVQADEPVAPRPGAPELVPHFSRLGAAADAPLLILLDDAARLRERAQEMKLAALGRLSANIAHEIRNPLAAISHASQLLAESEDFGVEVQPQNRRLLSMIQRHTERIDKIVKDVLALSRREPANPTQLQLKPWLVRTAGLYQESHAEGPRPIELIDIPPELTVRFDPNQLQQVLFNLWDNAFAHGARGGRHITVLISAGLDDSGRPWLEVSDNGAGIPEQFVERMFEPFFTTAHQGTGLGLFLARELCEYNQARIVYQPSKEPGARFRLVFAYGSS